MSRTRDSVNAEEAVVVAAAPPTVPMWIPIAVVSTTLVGYVLSFRLRLWLAMWRRAERKRVERRYEMLYDSRACSIPLQLDDEDHEGAADAEESADDETAVSVKDIEEFRSSLGIQSPRDDDLLSLVERILIEDPIPDGWVLFRTPNGFLRFMESMTGELHFFHPGSAEEARHIYAELRHRNQATRDARVHFTPREDREGSMECGAPISHIVRNVHIDAARLTESPDEAPFASRRNDVEFSNDDEECSTFHQLFHYFVQREKRKIDKAVAKSYHNRGAGWTNESFSFRGGGNGAMTPRRTSVSLRVTSSALSSSVNPVAERGAVRSRPAHLT